MTKTPPTSSLRRRASWAPACPCLKGMGMCGSGRQLSARRDCWCRRRLTVSCSPKPSWTYARGQVGTQTCNEGRWEEDKKLGIVEFPLHTRTSCLRSTFLHSRLHLRSFPSNVLRFCAGMLPLHYLAVQEAVVRESFRNGTLTLDGA